MRRNGIYYYRRRIPTDLIAVFGKREIQRSLGTTKPKEAEKRAAVEDLKWHEQFAAAAVDLSAANGSPPSTVAGPPLSEAEAIRLVQEYVERADERMRRRLTADPPATEKQKAEMIADAETGAQIVRHRDDPRSDELVYAAGQEILSAAGRSADDPDLDYAAFAEWVRRGLIELDRRKLSHLQDEHEASFFDDLFSPLRRSTPFGTVARQFLDELEEDARANKTSQKWIDKQRANVALVLELISPDTPVQSIRYDECQQFRRTLARIPSNRNKIYPDLSIAEQIERAELEGRPLLSTETQKGYLGALRNVLDLASKKHLIAVNAADGLAPLVRERLSSAEKRVSFTVQQLKNIFEGGFYRDAAQHACPWEHAKPAWRFWLPLMCLFMGLRPNEACQAYVGDLKRTAQGTWYLDITATADDDEQFAATGKTLKTASSRRRVPLHPALRGMGFVEFAEAQAKGNVGGRLFPDLKPDKYKNSASYALKRFREDFLPACIELSARQSFYSFRHNFRDALRHIDAPPDALQGLGGWSQGKRASDSYGDRSDPDYLVRFVNEVDFPGLDISFLYVRRRDIVAPV